MFSPPTLVLQGWHACAQSQRDSEWQWLSTLQTRYIPRRIEQSEVGCPSVAMERRCWMFGSRKDRLQWVRLAALWLCVSHLSLLLSSVAFVFSCYFWHCSSTGVKVFRRPALMPREMRNRGITRCVLQVAMQDEAAHAVHNHSHCTCCNTCSILRFGFVSYLVCQCLSAWRRGSM